LQQQKYTSALYFAKLEKASAKKQPSISLQRRYSLFPLPVDEIEMHFLKDERGVLDVVSNAIFVRLCGNMQVFDEVFDLEKFGFKRQYKLRK
jgi:hypothetical protein